MMLIRRESLQGNVQSVARNISDFPLALRQYVRRGLGY